MSKLVADGMHWKHSDFVRHAAQLVTQCRRVLAWSYARAYYIADKNAKTLFEFRQSELEQYTEKLVSTATESARRLSQRCSLVGTTAHSGTDNDRHCS